LHCACAETFFKRELELESKSKILNEQEKAEKRRERQEMMEILKRFEEESNDDELEVQQRIQVLDEVQEEEEDVDNDSLATRLEALGIVVDDASPEAIWDVLTADERESFLKTIKDSSAVAALSQQVQRDFEKDVWWTHTLGEYQDARVPRMIEVPASLIPQKVDLSHTKSPLIYNLVSIW
jgi:hypothetical protein